MKEDKKKTFIFRTDWLEYLDMLNSNDLFKCLHIIKDYVENLTEPKKPNLSDRLLMVWLFIKSQLDKDIVKYDKRCETSKENGKKGGRPKKNKNLKNLENLEKHDNEYEYDNDYEHDYDINNLVVVDIYTYIESNFGRTLTPVEYETISNWQDNELTRYAIKQAILNGAYSVKYISRILESYSAKGITTVIQAQKDEQHFKNYKDKSNVILENKPGWQDKNIEEDKATDEEIKKLEERIKKNEKRNN